jgi:hypothetical protein
MLSPVDNIPYKSVSIYRLGKACSHIAALLFKMMMATLLGLNNEYKRIMFM